MCANDVQLNIPKMVERVESFTVHDRDWKLEVVAEGTECSDIKTNAFVDMTQFVRQTVFEDTRQLKLAGGAGLTLFLEAGVLHLRDASKIDQPLRLIHVGGGKWEDSDGVDRTIEARHWGVRTNDLQVNDSVIVRKLAATTRYAPWVIGENHLEGWQQDGVYSVTIPLGDELTVRCRWTRKGNESQTTA